MKRFICTLLAISLCCSIGVSAFAEYSDSTYADNYEGKVIFASEPSRAEETEWVVRFYDGLIQRRLWSITYGYWLTDWETIGYYDP